MKLDSIPELEWTPGFDSIYPLPSAAGGERDGEVHNERTRRAVARARAAQVARVQPADQREVFVKIGEPRRPAAGHREQCGGIKRRERRNKSVAARL